MLATIAALQLDHYNENSEIRNTEFSLSGIEEVRSPRSGSTEYNSQYDVQ